MKLFIRILTVASMSSVYLMQVPCTSTGPGLNATGGNGLSILPNLPSPTTFLSGLPIIGGLF